MHETRTTQKLRKESRQGFEQNLTGKTYRVGYLDFEGDMLRGLGGARMATSGLRVLENQRKIPGRRAPDLYHPLKECNSFLVQAMLRQGSYDGVPRNKVWVGDKCKSEFRIKNATTFTIHASDARFEHALRAETAVEISGCRHILNI
nr:hypothetical protein Iba_chr02aCG5030 [Ipomoea batatas]